MTVQEGERSTARVILRFRDGELLEAHAALVNLDEPELCVRVADPRSNAREVVIPYLSLKYVLLRRDELEPSGDAVGMRKAAVHLWDGEVLKGYVAGGPERHSHGMILPLVSPTLDEIEVFAIPYAAVKGLFFLERWDGRVAQGAAVEAWPEEREQPPLLRVLGEIHVLSRMHVRGDIDAGEYQRRRRDALSRL